MMKNAILGFSTNHNRKDVEIFVKSARRFHHADVCDLIVFVNKFELWFDQFKEMNVVFLPTVSTYNSKRSLVERFIAKSAITSFKFLRYFFHEKFYFEKFYDIHKNLMEMFLHPHYSRWIAFERFLSVNQKYRFVLLSDVRDVVFQASVFDNVASDNTLMFFEQDVLYGDPGCDTDWYRDAFGEDALKGVLGKPALCIGTVIGDGASIKEFSKIMAMEFVRHPYCGVEQAVFNRLVHNKMIDIKYSIEKNCESIVGTLTSSKFFHRLSLFDRKICYADSTEPIPLIHMYERHESTNIFGFYNIT